MEYRDKTLTCVECGKPFIFTAGEQLFYAEKNFQNEPKRCKECKAVRGTRTDTAKRDKVRTTAVCASCGKETTVPFKPTQGRPVYCSSCYQQQKRGPAASVERAIP
ncbi:MAG: zinc-ribbon domain containing protein [Acidobacteriota bacterium]